MTTTTETELTAEQIAAERQGSFRTMVARFPGKCRRCKGDILPGDVIRWRPRLDSKGKRRKGGMSYHLAARCPGPPVESEDDE